MKAINAIRMGGVDVLPLVEGGKGVAVSNGQTAGAWAAAGGVGTLSAVNADSYDAEGRIIPQVYRAKTRSDRHDELVAYGIAGGIAQAQRARASLTPPRQRAQRGGEGSVSPWSA